MLPDVRRNDGHGKPRHENLKSFKSRVFSHRGLRKASASDTVITGLGGSAGIAGTVAIYSDDSRADESNGQRHGWPSMKLLFGIWVCLGLAFVWLAWSTYHTYPGPGLVCSFVTTAVILTAGLGIWHALACRRHHRRLLSSMQSS